MNTTISKKAKLLVLAAAIMTSVMMYVILFVPPPVQSAYYYMDEEMMQQWMGGYSLPEDLSVTWSAPEDRPPEIVYFSDNDTFQLRNPEIWQNPVYIGYRMSKKDIRPREYDDIWYNANVSVEGNRLSYDYTVYNGAGIDCRHAVYNVTLSVSKVNTSVKYIDEEFIAYLPVEDIEVNNLAAAESRKYRINADLIKPEKDEIYKLTFTVNWPGYFTDYKNKKRLREDICTKCNPHNMNQPSSNIGFYIYGEDAPSYPQRTYTKERTQGAVPI